MIRFELGLRQFDYNSRSGDSSKDRIYKGA